MHVQMHTAGKHLWCLQHNSCADDSLFAQRAQTDPSFLPMLLEAAAQAKLMILWLLQHKPHLHRLGQPVQGLSWCSLARSLVQQEQSTLPKSS